MAHEAGKGSRPRPFSVSREKFDANWAAIFGDREKSVVPTDTAGTETTETKESRAAQD